LGFFPFCASTATAGAKSYEDPDGDYRQYHADRDDYGSEIPDALACSFSNEGTHIRVFYDRILRMADLHSPRRSLAHVLVHEITHILADMERHFDHGVMRA
jgi:hypothetical protein